MLEGQDKETFSVKIYRKIIFLLVEKKYMSPTLTVIKLFR